MRDFFRFSGNSFNLDTEDSHDKFHAPGSLFAWFGPGFTISAFHQNW